MSTNNPLARRGFLKSVSATGLTLTSAIAAQTAAKSGGGRVIGANARINLGVIGCGGRGAYDAEAFDTFAQKHENSCRIAAVCDVYEKRKNKAAGRYNVKGYLDYRELLTHGTTTAIEILLGLVAGCLFGTVLALAMAATGPLHGTLKFGIAACTACVDYLEDSTIAGFQNSPLEATCARLVIFLVIDKLEAADWAAGLLDSDVEDRRPIRHYQTKRVKDIAVPDAPRSGVPDGHLNRCNALGFDWLALVNEAEFFIVIRALQFRL